MPAILPPDREETPRRPPRVVLDINLLVAGAYAPASASRRAVNPCLRGEGVAVVSPALRREYEHVLRRAVRGRDHEEMLARLLDGAERVEAVERPRVVPDDPRDDKLAAALAGRADALVTSDRHLLALGPGAPVPVLGPAAFVRLWLDG